VTKSGEKSSVILKNIQLLAGVDVFYIAEEVAEQRHE